MIGDPFHFWKVSLGLTVLLLGVCGGLSLGIHRVRVDSYNPNEEPVEDRIERGQERALSWEEFRELYPQDEAEEDE